MSANQNEASNDQQQEGMGRRQAVKWLMGLGATAVSVSLISPVLGLKPLQTTEKIISPGDTLVYKNGSKKGQAAKASDFKPGDTALLAPKGKEKNQNNLVNLWAFQPSQLKSPTIEKGPLNKFQKGKAGGPSGTIDWTVNGLVAYSSICTHLGCVVPLKLTNGITTCPCHGSQYEPAAGCKVVRSPAPRPLPQLPIKTNSNGELVAEGYFEAPVGPQS